MITQVTVGFAEEGLRESAAALANYWGLTVDNHALPRLSLTPDKLVLLSEGHTPFYVELDSLLILRRRQHGKKQGLVRACHPRPGLRIIDATAGWGRDASILAGFGAEVLMLERSPVVGALLTDALNRLQQHTFSKINLSFHSANAIDYFRQLTAAQYPDVIYIDPMHPVRQKSALVKKDMQILQTLIAPDDDALALIEQAIAHVRNRVVVKWPQHAKPLLTPAYSIQGKTVRYDVYTRDLSKC